MEVDPVEDAHCRGLPLRSQIGVTGQRLPRHEVAMKQKIASLRGDPVRVPVVVVDAKSDALAWLRVPGPAKRDDRVSRAVHPADAIEVEHGMSARPARHDFGTEAWYLVDLRQGAKFRVPGVDRHIGRFVDLGLGHIERGVGTAAGPNRGAY